MSAKSKARCDAVLKSLPPALQETIWQWINGPEGYAGTRQRLADEHGIHTSKTSLSRFYSWYPLQKPLEEASHFADELKKHLSELPGLTMNEEQLTVAAQVAFELEAVKAKNFDQFALLRKLRQKDTENRLEREKFELLKKKAEQAEQAEQITKSDLTPAEKQQRMRAIFGMS